MTHLANVCRILRRKLRMRRLSVGLQVWRDIYHKARQVLILSDRVFAKQMYNRMIRRLDKQMTRSSVQSTQLKNAYQSYLYRKKQRVLHSWIVYTNNRHNVNVGLLLRRTYIRKLMLMTFQQWRNVMTLEITAQKVINRRCYYRLLRALNGFKRAVSYSRESTLTLPHI